MMGCPGRPDFLPHLVDVEDGIHMCESVRELEGTR